MSRKFEIVPDEFKDIDGEGLLPIRSTKKSAGYDFKAPIDFFLEPYNKKFIWTDVRAIMEDDEFLIIYPRSSLSINWGIKTPNIPIIDADYTWNKKTGGNIGLVLENQGFERVKFKRGDKLAQGIFQKYLIAENCNSDEERTGGFGSTK